MISAKGKSPGNSDLTEKHNDTILITSASVTISLKKIVRLAVTKHHGNECEQRRRRHSIELAE
jgi:hypothetical protein